MTWSKFDDLYDEHENVENAWFAFPPNPVGLHILATTACNRWLTDGVVRPRWLEHKLPKPRDRERIVTAMVKHGLFDFLRAGTTVELVDSDGVSVVLGPFSENRYLVHDFLDYHDSKRQVEERRAKDAKRKRAGSRKDSVGSPDGIQLESNGSPSVRVRAGAQARAGVPTRPDPNQPPPLPPASGGRQRDWDRFQAELQAWAASAVPDLAPRVAAGAVNRLRAGKVPEDELTADRIRARAASVGYVE